MYGFDWSHAKELAQKVGGFNDLARSMGKNPSYIRRYFMDPGTKSAIKKIPFEDACKIADYVGCSVDNLRARSACYVAEAREQYIAGRKLPVVGRVNASRAEPPIQFDGDRPLCLNILGEISTYIEDPDLFSVEIEGESMMPAYHPGDRAIVSPAAGIVSGRVHFLQDSQLHAIIRRVRIRGEQYLLSSYNPLIEPEIIDQADTKRIYLVVARVDRRG